MLLNQEELCQESGKSKCYTTNFPNNFHDLLLFRSNDSCSEELLAQEQEINVYCDMYISSARSLSLILIPRFLIPELCFLIIKSY